MITNETLLNISMTLMPELSILGDKCHFSYIIKKNEIVSMGVNSSKTHTEAHKKGYPYPSIHAELAAFLKAPYGVDLSCCKMVNIRLSRLSVRKNRPVLRMSKPCIHCMPWVSKIFKKIEYTTDNGFVVL